MRDFKNMKRQRGRNRNGGQQSGGAKPQQNVNRAFDSNGPEHIKIRGHAQHVYEKYQQLARDASTAGDRVLAENYLQHAEHYFRTIRALSPNRQVTDIVGRESFASGFDIDFEDEGMQAALEATDAAALNGPPPGEVQAQAGAQSGEGAEAVADAANGQQRDRWEARPPRENRGDRPYNDRPYNRDGQGQAQGQNPNQGQGQGQGQQGDRPRYENRDRPYNREDRPAYNRDDRGDRPRTEGGQPQQQQQDRPRYDRQDRDRPRTENGERTERQDRPRDDRSREDRPREDRGDRSYAREDRAPREDAPEVVTAAPVVAPVSEVVARAKAARVLRSEDGGVSQLPAFLQGAAAPAPTPAPADAEEGEVRRPRRRRARAAVEGEGGGEPSEG
ncbi:DUF4167 domain-containing protein [soil metagenome]